jgi:hypothetical protein
VFVDGRLLGVTPFHFGPIQVGEYSVKITKRYFEDYLSRVTILEGDKNALSAKLAKGKGKVSIVMENNFGSTESYRVGTETKSITNGGYVDFDVEAGPVELWYTLKGAWRSRSVLVNTGETVRFYSGYAGFWNDGSWLGDQYFMDEAEWKPHQERR